MDRILLGNTAVSGASSKSGFWVSKPGVNVIAYASNGYYAGTDPGPDGLVDGKVLPIYSYNENFSFTGSNTYTFGFTPRTSTTEGRMYSTSDGTLRFIGNTTSHYTRADNYWGLVLNNSPSWQTSAPGWVKHFWTNKPEDKAFNGNSYLN